MSAVHSLPHTVEAASADLVPSRYAVRIGEIDVMVISDGVLPIGFETMSTNVDPQGGPPGWTTGSCRKPSTGP